MTKDENTHPRQIGWKGGVAGLTVLGFIFLSMLNFDNAVGDDQRTPGLPRHEAWGACQDAVKADLANPATADFDILTTEDEQHADGGFEFSGSLSADNDFGVEQALIFSCEVKPDGSATADVRAGR